MYTWDVRAGGHTWCYAGEQPDEQQSRRTGRLIGGYVDRRMVGRAGKRADGVTISGKMVMRTGERMVGRLGGLCSDRRSDDGLTGVGSFVRMLPCGLKYGTKIVLKYICAITNYQLTIERANVLADW